MHAMPGRILAKTPLAQALEEEDVGKIKMLADLRPNPVYAMHSAFAYALNHGKTELFVRLFQQYGTPDDMDAMSNAILSYWIEILRKKKVGEYFGDNPRENGCWQLFWKIVLRQADTVKRIKNALDTFSMISEPFVHDAILYGVVDDVKLIKDEPNLEWLTYRRRAQLLTEFADDFRAALDDGNPILASVNMAVDLMGQGVK